MTRKTRPYRELRLERLSNPGVAVHYLNLAMEDSPESFLQALGNVAQARQITNVAKLAGVQRETLYRAFSEQGNPTLGTLNAVFKAVGLKLSIELDASAEDIPPIPVSSAKPHPTRQIKHFK